MASPLKDHSSSKLMIVCADSWILLLQSSGTILRDHDTCAFMFLGIRGIIKRPTTDVTFVRFESGVLDRVGSQVLPSPEAFSAQSADIRPVIAMHHDVLSQTALRLELFATMTTGVNPILIRSLINPFWSRQPFLCPVCHVLMFQSPTYKFVHFFWIHLHPGNNDLHTDFRKFLLFIWDSPDSLFYYRTNTVLPLLNFQTKYNFSPNKVWFLSI